ncbi:YihY/virulence factor BrkB family protein [Rhodococcus sp. X156]|uniref:YihY/virulence factor BrkB family protein n=1 Tax=Rhodococcus sp. X156 TaxID=2499145 RepID=UPI0019D17B23|nr:YihY/virulence factor BrkB family protein [Rhodococcus sp. X156]
MKGTFTERVDGFQRRHRWAGYPLAVVYKFFDDQGNYLAALIAYYAFVSLFPLLYLSSTVLGYVLSDDVQLQQQLIDSAVGQFPVIGDQLQHPDRMTGGFVPVSIGVLGSLYGASGVAQATQHAMNTAWGVPRNNRPNPFAARGRSVLLIATVGLAVLGITALSIFARYADGFGIRGPGVGTLLMLTTVVLNSWIFSLTFRLASTRKLTLRNVLPGAVAAAVAWQLLQVFGATFVQRVIARASAINGVFALVLGLIAFLYIAALVVVLCAEANVVRVDHLYPRALLTPFTDNVDLTAGDRRVYTTRAEATRHKGFEDVTVTFQQPPTRSEPKTGEKPQQRPGPKP